MHIKWIKYSRNYILISILFPHFVLGIDAITRREAIDDHFSDLEVQQRLYAKSEDDENPPPEVTNPKWEFYQVTKIECQSGWSNMDAWEMADMTALGDCSDYGDNVSNLIKWNYFLIFD